MFSTGEFAQFTGVSVQALHDYAEAGLLRHARVDPQTGYRRYTVDQIPLLNRIVLLHDLGLPVDKIGDLLTADNTDLERVYANRTAEIVDAIARMQAQVRAVRARHELVRAGATAAAPEVVVRAVEPLLVATLTGDADEDVATLFYRLESYVRERHARARRPPLTLHPEDDVSRVSVIVPITRLIPASNGIEIKLLDAVPRMACAVHRGGYPGLTGLLQGVLRWLAATGERPAGPIREVYLRFGAADELGLFSDFLSGERTDLVTEVQVPLRE